MEIGGLLIIVFLGWFEEIMDSPHAHPDSLNPF